MGEFVKQLRRIRIKAPTTRDWCAETWASDFARIAVTDTADQLVFDAGLWFGNKLSAYWRDVQFLELAKYDRLDIHAKSTLAINRVATELLKASTSPSEELLQDYYFTSFGDTLNRALQYFSSIHDFGEELISDNVLRELLALFNSIYVFEFAWDRVLWAGWGMTRTDAEIKLLPMTIEAEQMLRHEAVAEYLRQAEGQQLQILHANEWKAGQHRNVSPPVIQLLRYQAPRATFSVEYRPVTDMPAYLPYLLSQIPDWLGPMLTRPVADLDGNGLIEVLNVWRLLFDAVSIIIAADEVGLIHIDDAISLITRIRRHLSASTARKVIGFLVLDPSKRKGDGVWSAPFVEIAENVLCPVIPCLMHPNVQRMVDLWAERCVPEQLLIVRGSLWEQHLRDSLVTGFEQSPWKDDFWVQPTDLKRWGHQIDVLFRVGKLVVVGETKFAKYPCIPAEFGRFFQETLDYGATQVGLRRQSLENNRADLAKFCKFDGDPNDLVIFPLIISPHFLGSGMKFRGIDCVSYDDLLHFFVKDRLPVGGFNPPSTNSITEASLRYKMDGERNDVALLRYLKQPPQTFLYDHGVERVERRFTSPLDLSTTISWQEGVVNYPTDTDGLVAFAESVEEKWNAEVLTRGAPL